MAYIGASPSNGVRRKHTYTATASQTTFSGAGAEGVSLSYRDSNYVDVYVNGVKLGDADYTATSGTSIVLGVGAAVNDIVEIMAYDVFSVADTVSKADGGTFDGNVTMAGTLDVTGDLTVDTSTLYVDSANNRVGIGETSPLGILHVRSSDASITSVNANADDLIIENNGNCGISIASSTTGEGNINFIDSGDTNIGRIQYLHSTNEMIFRVNDAERMRIDSSGNVGIGTTNPATFSAIPANRLVVGTGSSDEGITIYSSTSTAGTLAFADGTSGDAEYRGFVQYHHNGDYMRFFTAATESMRIDSSGNLLVGKTSAGLSNVGFQVLPTGVVGITRSGSNPLDLNRLSSDGNLIEFNKDGTTVGSIGTASSDLTIFSSASGHAGLRLANGYVAPTNNTGGISDNTADLGISNYRFKDLYLSGGAYIGGTGSANYLDDYEEGSFTPTFGGSGGNQTVSYAFQFGTYVKVGKLVFVNISVGATGTPSGGSGDLIIANLPFNSKSGVQQAGSMAFANNISFGSSGTQGYCNIEGNVNYLNINSQELVGTSSMSRVPASGIHNTDPRIVCTICYETA